MDIDNVCRSIIKIEKCTKNDQCSENAECVKEKCICNKEFVSSSNYTVSWKFSHHIIKLLILFTSSRHAFHLLRITKHALKTHNVG